LNPPSPPALVDCSAVRLETGRTPHMLETLTGRGKCLIGFHQGEWEYSAPSRCDRVQICELCGIKSVRLRHQYAWQYEAPNKCRQILVCERCGIRDDKSRRIKHPAVGWWEPLAPHNKCAQVRKCIRCGTNMRARTVHSWGEWRSSSPFSREHRVCSRCGKKEYDDSGWYV
jgi:hypothetical protein